MSKKKPDWNKIYSGLSPKLLGICRRYIQDIYTAEDIVHDSFITAIQKNDQLNDEKALFAWLKKIVINNALQHIRKHSKDNFVSTEPSEIPDTSSEMDHPILEEKNIFIYDFTHEELLSSIDSLPLHHKSVKNKMVIGITFLIIMITSVFLLYQKRNVSVKNFTDSSSSGSVNSNKKKALSSIHNASDPPVNKVPVASSVQNTSENTVKNDQNASSSEKHPEQQKVMEIQKGKKNIINKDSLNETSQKVIVVKKIIKRDTIFIEK